VNAAEPSRPPSPLADLLSRLTAQSLPVVYFLVTVSFYLRTYDSAQVKITFTQIGCTLVGLLWMAQLLIERRWPYTRKDLPLVAPILAVLASGIVSFAQSSFLAGSVDEFLRRVLYALMALVAVAEFRSWERHRRLLRWLLAAFGVVVFYGFVQYFDTRLFPPGQGAIALDPFVWRHAFGLRPFSTFGNPNFYGNFLVIITPIIMAIYLRSGGQVFRPYVLTAIMVAVVYFADRLFVGSFGGVAASTRPWVQMGLFGSCALAIALIWWRTPTAAASGMLLFWGAMFVNLYATETKGAWLGFLGAIATTTILVALFFTGMDRMAALKRLGAVVGVTLLLGVSVVGYYASRRFQSVSFRVFTWIATWEMVRAQPLLGTGIGSFKWAYPAYRRPEIILVEGKSNTETDHAEDEYLEVWYDEGIIGFGVFIWMIVVVSVLGVRALNRLTKQEDRGPPGVAHHFNERAYSLLAYLGAWWGALIHWLMDVSVRFVSSGIYSLLLPALVISLVRNEKMEYRQDAPSPLDRWVRAANAVFWTAVFLSLDMAPIPSVACGASLWLLGELLELRLTPEAAAPAGEPGLTAESLERDLRSHAAWRYLAVAALLGAWAFGFRTFRNYFIADVNHNLAIFFSKQGVWTKSPEFEGAVAAFPAEMQREYAEVGGALEHYEKVVRLNPFFPMARYFIGNVYNDWGSSFHNQSLQARQSGDVAGALAKKARAVETWERALKTYERLKRFAPNYVQTHHQVGLVYLKMGDMEKAWGDEAKVKEYWDLALKHFDLYEKLDPVFPPNYYRQAYIRFVRGEYDRAEEDYRRALVHNSKNVVGRLFPDRNAETYVNLGRLNYLLLANEHPGKPDLPPGAPRFRKAEEAYAAGMKEQKPEESWGFEAMKGLAILYSRGGLRAKAEPLWLKLRQVRPDDADVRTVFR
jgi:tetratricopeptide (TPR) repeat protein/O-antigen ligase